MEDWGTACPGDDQVAHMTKIKPNRVQLMTRKKIRKVGFKKLMKSYAPDVLVFQVEHRKKGFVERRWRKFLSRIPAKKKCLIIGPSYSRNFASDKSYTNQLKDLIKETKHHCRLISTLDEMHEAQSSRAGL